MADNVNVSQGVGTVMATNQISGVHYPRTKVTFGDPGTAVDVATDNPLPVELQGASTVTVSNIPAVGQAVEAASLPVVIASDQSPVPVSVSSIELPTGASTSALQTAGNTFLSELATNSPTLGQKVESGSVPVVIASDQVVPVSLASSPLPTGAATAALQNTGNTSLATLATNSPTLGQKTESGSVPVTIASDQVLPLPSGAATATLQSTGNTSVASIDTKTPTLGQKAEVGSVPVVIASDQSAVPISVSALPLPTGAATSANQTTANTSLATLVANSPTLGQKAEAGSVPVVIASDQVVPISATALPLPTGAATAANQATANTSLASIATNTAGTGPLNNSVSPAVITIGTSAVLLAAGGSNYANRTTLMLTNVSNVSIYIGTSGVTTSSYGAVISPAQTLVFSITAVVSLYGIAATTGNSLAVMEGY